MSAKNMFLCSGIWKTRLVNLKKGQVSFLDGDNEGWEVRSHEYSEDLSLVMSETTNDISYIWSNMFLFFLLFTKKFQLIFCCLQLK